MPGPGNKSKPKPKKLRALPSEAQARSVDVRPLDIGDDETWIEVIAILCAAFDLPDLTTRNGLKKVYTNFDAIYRKLDDAYKRNIENERIRGGIIGIYTTMGVDSILRNKLFEKGFLDKLIPLLHIDSTRHLALRALATMTHHGGGNIRTEIAKHANTIAKLVQAYPDDEYVADLGVSTLAHTVSRVVDGGPSPNEPKILKSLDMNLIIRAVVDTVRKPFLQARSIIDHTIELTTAATLHASESFHQYPPAIDFLIAGLRSKDWVSRCSCLSGLIRLHYLGAESDQRGLDPHKLIASIERRVPSHLMDVLIDYGEYRSEMFMTATAMAEFQRAMTTCLQTRDLYRLGLQLAALILRTEFSIADGQFESEDPVTGKRQKDNCGLPFTSYVDALPHCARAIRAKGKRDELDFADILEIKFYIMRFRVPDAVVIARKGIERNPQCSYFYYTLTLAADYVQGLKAAKQGMKCKQITPFVRFQMMQRAVEHAGGMGLKILQEEMPDEGAQRWEQGIAFLMSALEDAKTYVAEAPPDNRHMKNIGYWYILLMILTREQLSPDLCEIRDGLQRLRVADEFSAFMGIPPPKTNMRLAQQIVVKRYETAVKTFGPVFDKFDQLKATSPPTKPHTEQLGENLAAWLDDQNVQAPGTRPVAWRGSGSMKVNFEHVTLYRCNWCGNPSAVLKRCAGCSKSRYCDSACQRAHWMEHKKVCKPEQISLD